MAFKTSKNNSVAQQQTTSTCSVDNDHQTLLWYSISKVMETEKEVKEGIVKFEIKKGCFATFFDKTDSCCLNIWGFEIWCKVGKTKDGHRFLSFPSYKKKDDTYGDYVKCFDKGFHDLIKELISKVYE